MAGNATKEIDTTTAVTAVVDADFKDREAYEVFRPEGSEEYWHVVVSQKDGDKFTQWALLQMLQAKDWETDFEWAVFMKTGRVGSSGLRHFSKKFTDGVSAFKTYAEWFSDKCSNPWLGSISATMEKFHAVEGQYLLLSAEEARHVLENKGQKERYRPVLGKSDVPVDIYFKDRDDYQVYVTPEGDLWTAVMSIKQGGKHTQYAILQALVAKPDVKVEFEFVVFLRHGKIGGSAQRYAKRYTVEVAALSTFQQWFKEKTNNEWYGSFKDSLEEFEPVHGKFGLLEKSQWGDVIEFEEHGQVKLTDSGIPVDVHYRDRNNYRVYHTEQGNLWAAVLSQKDEAGQHRAFVILQLLAKVPDSVVEFDFVVLKRSGEKGQSGQWTAKKFTNELDALRTFKMWYEDQSGAKWKGSFNASFESFKATPDKLVPAALAEWEEIVGDKETAEDQSSSALTAMLASSRKGRAKPEEEVKTTPQPRKAPAVDSSPVKPKKEDQYEVLEDEVADIHCGDRDKYTKVVLTTQMLQKEASGKNKFYIMQLLAPASPDGIPEAEKFYFFVRTGRVGGVGATNFKHIRSIDNGRKAFAKKFSEKTKNDWMGSFEKTLAVFTPCPGEFQIVRDLSDGI